DDVAGAGDQAQTASPTTNRRRRFSPRRRRPFRHGIRPPFSPRPSPLPASVVPPPFILLNRLVLATTPLGRPGILPPQGILVQHNGAVGLLWHEEVMTVAFGYAYLGFRPHTLASVGESGEVIARMLTHCGFVVFRGGSTTHRSRRREGALQEMIDHMQTHDQV